MRSIWRLIAKYSPVVAGTVFLKFAIDRWLWYRTLPRYADARICGNCFLATVGLPLELGLIGSLLLFRTLIRPKSFGSTFYWLIVVVGVLLTPLIWGVPLFAFGYGVLLWHFAKTAARQILSMAAVVRYYTSGRPQP